MSKRYPQHPKPAISKKPKLDVSISSRSTSTSSSSRSNDPPKVPKSHETKNVDIWGDDDDVILLASQALDKIEECSQSILIEHETMLDTSYSNFQVNVQASTQKVKNNDDQLKDLLEDDDGFENIETYFRNEYMEQQEDDIIDRDKPSTSTFKRPEPPKKFNLPPRVTTKEPETVPYPKSNFGYQSSSESIQVEFLAGKLEEVKKTNEKLNQEMSAYNEKVLTKEGEVSILRQELQQLKRSNESLRLEKLQENETSKKEYLDKIHELEKLIQAQKSELEFKNAEMKNIKSKKSNETQKPSTSTAPEPKPSTSASKSVDDLTQMYALLDLHIPLDTKLKKPMKVPSELFRKTPAGSEKFGEPPFRRELENLQCIIGRLQLVYESNKESRKEMEEISENVIQSAIVVFKQGQKYAKQLKFTKYRDTNASVEHAFLSQKMEELFDEDLKTRSIFQEKNLYVDEKACIFRRVVAALSIVCEYSKMICEKFYTAELEGEKLFDVMLEIVDLIGYSEELYNHFGLIEAFGELLNSFVHNAKENSPTNSYLLKLLKLLIFCRPDHRPMVKICKCLQYITLYWEDKTFVNSLCAKNPTESFVVNEEYKIFQFSSDACPLQVYGTLLEVAIPEYVDLSRSQIDSLCSICYSHIIFLRKCIEILPEWMWFTEADPGQCDCYIKLTTGYIILFYQVVKLWRNRPFSIEKLLISKICKLGVILLFNIFCSNYRREVLQSGGSAVKNRLQMLHYWLCENQEKFDFVSIHTYALNAVKMSNIISDPIRNSEEKYTEQSRKDGDAIWEEIFKTFFDDKYEIPE